MKLTSSVVLSALTIAAASPTVSAAPFPADSNASTNGGQGNGGTPSLSSSVGPSAGNAGLVSPEPDATLSPRARAIDRFGSVGAQRRSSVRLASNGKGHERRQLLPNVGGLGLDANTLSALGSTAGSPLNGLGLGLGLPNAALGQANSLLGNTAGTLQGTLSSAAGAGSGLGVLGGLTGDLPLVGPLLAQVEGLAGLGNVLGGGSAPAGLGGVSKLVSPNDVAAALNAELIEETLLQRVAALQPGGLQAVTGQLTGAMNSAQGTLGGVPQQLQGAAGLAGLTSTIPQIPSQVASAAGQVQGAGLGTSPQLQSLTNALPAGLSGAIPANLGGVLPSLPVPSPGSLMGPLLPLAGIPALNPASLPDFGGVANLGNTVNKLVSKASPPIDAPTATPTSLLPVPSISVSDTSFAATAINDAVGSVATQAIAAQGLANADLNDPSYAPSAIATYESTETQAAASSQSSMASAGTTEVASVYQAARPIVNSMPAALSSLALRVPAAGPAVPTNGLGPQRRSDESISPGGAMRMADNSPAGDKVPDVYDASAPEQQAAAPAVDPATSIAAAVQSMITSIESAAGPKPTGAADVDDNNNPLTYLKPPLTADPTRDPTDVDISTNAFTAPTGAPSQSADSASAPSATPTSAPSKRDLPAADSAQASALSATGPAAADDAVDQSNTSQLQPMAPDVSSLLQQYVASYAPPTSPTPSSPAASFYSTFSAPSSPTLTPDSSEPEYSAAVLPRKENVRLVSSQATSTPGPYPGWSQDTDYSKSSPKKQVSANGKPKSSSSMASVRPTAASLLQPLSRTKRHGMRDELAAVDEEEEEEHHEENALMARSRYHDDDRRSDRPDDADKPKGRGRRPAFIRASAYDGSNPSHRAQHGTQMVSKPTAIHRTHTRHHHAPTAAAAPAPDAADPAVDSPAEPVTPDSPPAERRRMVRFARYVKRDGVVEAMHQPPAGEHGEPADVSPVMPTVPAADGTDYPGDAPASTSSATPSSTGKGAKKSKGTGRPSGKGKGKGEKDGEGKKKTGKASKPKPEQDPEETEAGPSSAAKKRSLWRRMTMRRWL